jgi:hypothetical protein
MAAGEKEGKNPGREGRGKIWGEKEMPEERRGREEEEAGNFC